MRLFRKLRASKSFNFRFFIFVFWAVLGVLFASIAYKYFRLALTIPLLLVGGSFLLAGYAIGAFCSGYSSQAPVKYLKALRVSAILLGVTCVILSLGFSVFNLITYFWSPTSAAGQSYKRKNLGRYLKDNSSFWLSDALLGYKYKYNEKGITSRSVLVNQDDLVEDIIYDVTYNIDESGNRTSVYPRNYARSAVFVGGSFTFGEGLEDSESLPSLFALKSGFKVYNLGMHGYGPHQGLMQLSHPELRKKRVGSEKIDIVFYRFIVDHVSRVAGYSSWDPLGPCYRLDEKQSLKHVGSFEECKSPLKAVLVEPVLKRLSSSNEPWTSSVATKLINYRPAGSSQKELQTFLAVVSAMRDASSVLGAKFVVLVEDVEIQRLDNERKTCRINQNADQIVEQFKEEGIEFLRFSEFYSSNDCVNGDYVIRPFEDNHPSRAANQEWSSQLLRFVN